MKKMIAPFSCLIASIAIFSLAPPVFGAQRAIERAKIPVTTSRQMKCNPTTLSKVEAHLTKYQMDGDVEIPRISEIDYDGCIETMQAGDKGNIYIPNTTVGPVTITFKLKGLARTKWRETGEKSVFVGKPSPSAIDPPTAPTSSPCGGTVTKVDDNTVSFVMSLSCTQNPHDTFYAYALHLDQTGSDGIKVDIGIDPQIINHAPGGKPPR